MRCGAWKQPPRLRADVAFPCVVQMRFGTAAAVEGRAAGRPGGSVVGWAGAGPSAPHLATAALRRAADGVTPKERLG